MRATYNTRERGATMIEVLITILVTLLGLLGIAAVQARMYVAEMEAAQLAQATILLRYMSDRINANRKNAVAYVTADPVGVDKGQQNCSALTGASLDLCEWSNLLAGANETLGAQRVGSMIAARGCVFSIDPVNRRYSVALTWQGLTPTVASTSTTCGQGTYTDDRMRRAIVAPITLGCLQNDLNTGLCISP
jgi:type IV pilus assembly protein PilV